jgi:branched-chain amino acid transport system ATP-binding protein
VSGAALVVEGLRSGYAHVPVLVDVHLRVEPGEVVGLLGANGAGKTTLLCTLAGMLPARSGSIRLGDRDLTKTSPWKRVRNGLAHVPEGRRIFGAMTVDDNLKAAALVAPTRRREIRDEVYALFPRLAERTNQLAGSMSGGEQQMLAVGRALMCDPTMLMVDEMSAGLAPVVAQQLVDALVEISGRGRGVLLVEQSPHLIADMVERVYLLEQGRTVTSGRFADLGGADRLAELYLGVR